MNFQPLSDIKDNMGAYKIAAIPGDGIGKEVISAGLEALAVLAESSGEFEFRF